MRVHCPRCGKQFRVQSSAGDLEAENHFICSSCNHEFIAHFDKQSQVLKTLMAPEELLFTQDSKAQDVQFCPSCKGRILDIDEECPHCLKIPSRVLAVQTKNKKQEEEDPIDRRVKAVWQELLEHFEDPEAHQHFIDLCAKLDRLDFAEERFQNLQKVIGEEVELEWSLQYLGEARLRHRSSSIEIKDQRALRYLQTRWILYILGGVMLLLGGLGPSMRFISLIGITIIAWLLLDGIKK